MLTGMPISISLGLTVLTFLFIMTEVPIESVALKLFTGIEKFEIMAIPFFILAGNFLTHGGVARRMIRFATSMVGHCYGGLGLAGVLACALFAAVSGSSPATVVAIGSILLPAMVGGLSQALRRRRHHDLGRARHPDPAVDRDGDVCGVDQHLGRRAVHGRRRSRASCWRRCSALTTWYARAQQQLSAPAQGELGRALKAFRDTFWGLVLIVIVIGGIYTGLFTPTEAAAMSAVYAFIVAVFVYKDMSLKDVPRVLLDSANMSAMLLYIITNAVLFSFLMTPRTSRRRWPTGCSPGLGADRLPADRQHPAAAAGNLMEPSSIVLIMAPILFPVAMKLGIDPVHFGILMVVNMEVGMCHPPVGLNLYVASGITKMGITELTVAVWPWLLTMLVFLVVVTYWPPLSIWLPQPSG